MLVSPHIEFSEYDKENYMLHNGRSRYFIINEDSYDLIQILQEARDFRHAYDLYCDTNDDITSASEFEHHVKQLFSGKGILLGDETGEEAVSKTKRIVRLRLTLIPEKLAGALSLLLSPLYHKKVFPVLFLAAIAGSILIFSHYGNLDLTYALTKEEFWFMILFFMLSVIIHELGHISACRRYGGRHGGIGVGLYFVFPVFWADIHGIWMLPKKERLYINMAGIYIQLLMGLFFAAVYLVFRKLLFLESCFLITSAALFQLWPFVYLDGYWLMCDWLDTPNLNKVSTAKIKQIFQYYLTEKDLERPQSITKKEILLFLYACINYSLLLLFAFYLVIIIYRFFI